MSNKRKSFKKTNQQKLEQERFLKEKQEIEKDGKQIAKTIGIGVLSILLILSFCFPAVSMLMR